MPQTTQNGVPNYVSDAFFAPTGVMWLCKLSPSGACAPYYSTLRFYGDDIVHATLIFGIVDDDKLKSYFLIISDSKNAVRVIASTVRYLRTPPLVYTLFSWASLSQVNEVTSPCTRTATKFYRVLFERHRAQERQIRMTEDD